MMKFRSTGILLLVFAALAGYLYFFELKKMPSEEPVDKSTWVLTLSQDDVQQLTVTYQGKTGAFVKTDGVWHLGAVDGAEADATLLDSVVVSLVDLKATRVLTQSVESLATYGLEPPAMTVVLGLAGGGQEVLLAGDKNLQGTQYYVVHKGNAPVYLVYEALVNDLRELVANPPYKPTPEAGTPVPMPLESSTPAP